MDSSVHIAPSLLLSPQNPSRGVCEAMPGKKAQLTAISNAPFSCAGFRLPSEHAHQIGEHSDRDKETNPGQAELDRADIGFARRADIVMQNSHDRLPLFDGEF